MKTKFLTTRNPDCHQQLALAHAIAHTPRRASRPLKRSAAWLGLLAVACLTAQGSDPAGIYALVTKVTLAPNAANAQTIRISGAFVMAKGHGFEYDHARPGYLYYRLKPGEEQTCRKEWNDLQAVAGTGQIVSFASRYAEKGRIRHADEKASAPDVYPVAWGITRIRDSDYEPIQELMKFRDSHGRESPKTRTDKETKAVPARTSAP